MAAPPAGNNWGHFQKEDFEMNNSYFQNNQDNKVPNNLDQMGLQS